ncbi:histidine triad nucleotide-binding protein [Methylophilaceae bacterium]|jgi:histidine triad (HIT) family protein|nr:histidine triad nucleotide-binding protein [Methylophilaceae bacterium]|tara:strand:- start:3858 stop:4193 length:336 start_codon:yes stop_codon:yes gene_type:complete
MDNCLFCKISQKEIPSTIIYEDEEMLAFKDINPIDKVHFLIIPKEHIVNLMECNLDHQNILSKMLLLAPKLAKESNLKGFRVMINSGKSGGQEVFHIHFHVFGGSKKLAKL